MRHKQKQARTKSNAKLTQTNKTRQQQFWQKHRNRKLASVIYKKKTQNETKHGENNSQCRVITYRVKMPKEARQKQQKEHHKRQTKHLQPTLALRCTILKIPQNSLFSAGGANIF